MSANPASSPQHKKVSLITLREKKECGEPIVSLTAYDCPTALALDAAGVDLILVGDSLGMVVLGYETTLPVTMDEMLHHCRAVARGAKRAFLTGDMPFLSYQADVAEAVRNAGRFLAEAGMDSVKLEGGGEMAITVRAIVSAGIPVMGHIGLTPQSVHQLGGYRAQGRSATAARALLEDALELQQAGCFAIVLESVPARVATLISERLTVPTIGIGAGAGCDGQVLVSHDLLGLFDRFTPRFVKQYADLRGEMLCAFERYHTDVRGREFPASEHTFTIADDEWQVLLEGLEDEPPGG